MRFIRTASIAVAALALAACEQQSPAGPDATLNTGDRLVVNLVDIQEATLRYMFAEKGALGMDAYCLSENHPAEPVDPGQSLLDRFAGNAPPVVPLSDCTISVGGDTYNATGGPAEWFKIGTPTVQGRRATVETGFHINGRLAENWECDLRYTNQWVVSGCTLLSAA